MKAHTATMVLGLVLGLGCARPPPQAPMDVPVTPDLELKPPGAAWYIHASAPETAYAVVDFFGERDLLASMWQGTDAIRIRTLPVEQPEVDHRYQRITYFIKIDGDMEEYGCSWVELRWVLETRGYRDLAWRAETPGATFQPVELIPFAEAMRDKPCKRPSR